MWHIIIYFILLILFTYILKQLFSETPNSIKFQSKFFIFYFVSSLVGVILMPLFVFNAKNVKNIVMGSQIIKHVTKIIHVKWELRNGKELAVERSAVVVANHQSTLDVLGMFNIWHVMDKVAPVGRKEIFYVMPFGLAAYLAGMVFIDRNNAKDAYNKLKATSDMMIKNKTKIWLFPEGTRNKNGRTLLPFKKGAFNIAVAGQVPILPVVFSPYYFINRSKNIFNPGHIVVKCLEPIPTTGLTLEDVPELIKRVHSVMDLEYKSLTKEVFSMLPSNYPLAVARE